MLARPASPGGVATAAVDISLWKVCKGCDRVKEVDEFPTSGMRKVNGGPIRRARCVPCERMRNREYERAKGADWAKAKARRNRTSAKGQARRRERAATPESKEYHARYNRETAKGRATVRRGWLKRREDPSYRFKDAVASGVWRMMRGEASSKEALIGVDATGLRAHIEGQFEAGMCWEKYGVGREGSTWTLDHIIPISRYGRGKEEARRCWNYRNLRPAWDNYSKSARMPCAELLARVPVGCYPGSWGGRAHLP